MRRTKIKVAPKMVKAKTQSVPTTAAISTTIIETSDKETACTITSAITSAPVHTHRLVTIPYDTKHTTAPATDTAALAAYATAVTATDATAVTATDATAVTATDATVVTATDATAVTATDATAVVATDVTAVAATDATAVAATGATATPKTNENSPEQMSANSSKSDSTEDVKGREISLRYPSPPVEREDRPSGAEQALEVDERLPIVEPHNALHVNLTSGDYALQGTETLSTNEDIQNASHIINTTEASHCNQKEEEQLSVKSLSDSAELNSSKINVSSKSYNLQDGGKIRLSNKKKTLSEEYKNISPSLRLTKENLSTIEHCNKENVNYNQHIREINDDTMSVCSTRTSEENRLYKDRKKKFHDKLSGGGLETSLTMFDLIYFNPSTSPMPGREDVNLQTRKKKAIQVAASTQLEEEKVDDVATEETPKANCANEPNISRPGTPAGQGDDEEQVEDDGMLVPQLKIGPNGEVIVDQKSLIIKTSNELERLSKISDDVIEESEYTRKSFGKKRKRASDWTKNETAYFYKALSTIGTDFSLMKELFFKTWRNRAELKLKFKKEEKINKSFIDSALKVSSQYDMTIYESEPG